MTKMTNKEINNYTISDFENHLLDDFLVWGDMFEDNIYHLWYNDKEFRNEVMYTKVMPKINSWYNELQVMYNTALTKNPKLDIEDFISEEFDFKVVVPYMEKSIKDSYEKILTQLNNVFEEYVKNLDQEFVKTLAEEETLEKIHEFKVKELENESKHPKFIVLGAEPTVKLSDCIGKNRVLEDFKKSCFEEWSLAEAQEYAKEPDLNFLTTKDWEKLFNTLKVSAKILSGDY